MRNRNTTPSLQPSELRNHVILAQAAGSWKQVTGLPSHSTVPLSFFTCVSRISSTSSRELRFRAKLCLFPPQFPWFSNWVLSFIAPGHIWSFALRGLYSWRESRRRIGYTRIGCRSDWRNSVALDRIILELVADSMRSYRAGTLMSLRGISIS